MSRAEKDSAREEPEYVVCMRDSELIRYDFEQHDPHTLIRKISNIARHDVGRII
jgi:hypothetical protein